MLKSKPKYIFICTGADCKKEGSKKIIKELNNYLKDERLRRSVRVIKTRCMDYCKKAPNAICQDHLFHKTSSEELIQLVKEKKLLNRS